MFNNFFFHFAFYFSFSVIFLFYFQNGYLILNLMIQKVNLEFFKFIEFKQEFIKFRRDDV